MIWKTDSKKKDTLNYLTVKNVGDMTISVKTNGDRLSADSLLVWHNFDQHKMVSNHFVECTLTSLL